MKIKKIIVTFLAFFNFSYSFNYMAPVFHFWDNLDWSFFFDKMKLDFDLCTCLIKNSSQNIAGFKMTIVEPIGFIESSNTPWNFVGLGIKLDKSVDRRQGYSRGDEDSGAFRYVHFVIFPPLGMTFGLMQDFICFERGNIFNFAFLSEVSPTYNSDLLALTEESAKPVSRVWFSNPAAELACSVDCVSANFGKPINSLYWCDGCRGSVSAGNSGYISKLVNRPYEESEMLAFRIIDEMSFTGGMLKTSEDSFTYLPSGVSIRSSLCKPQYFPVIIKSQYFLQPAFEDKGDDAEPFGKVRVIYDFKMTLKQDDDVFFWLWRKKDFCAGATQCRSTFVSQ